MLLSGMPVPGTEPDGELTTRTSGPAPTPPVMSLVVMVTGVLGAVIGSAAATPVIPGPVTASIVPVPTMGPTLKTGACAAVSVATVETAGGAAATAPVVVPGSPAAV